MARTVVRLDVGIVRHFWEGGENAVWRSSTRLPPEIIRQIKDDYPLLMINRPVKRRYGDYEAAFDYQDEQDKFGRPAPAFAAAVYRYGDDPTRLAAVTDFVFPVSSETQLDLSFEHAFAAAPKVPRPKALAVQVNQRSEQVRKKRFPPVWIAGGVLAVAVACGAGVFAYNKFGPGARPPHPGSVNAGTGVAGPGLGPQQAEAQKGLTDSCVQLQAPHGARPTANCAMQYAFYYCSAPAPSRRGWERAKQVTTGYCGRYARLQEQDFLTALSGDLDEASFLSTWSKQALHDDLFQLPDTLSVVPEQPISEGGDARRLPGIGPTQKEPSTRAVGFPDLGRFLGRQDDAVPEDRRFIGLWNEALSDNRLARHRMMPDHEPSGFLRAYAMDYCALRAAVNATEREYKETGFEDPLLQAVSHAIAAKAGENQPAACAGETVLAPEDVSRIMAIEDERAAIRAMVEVVDFCSLVSWDSLGEQGVSRLVRSCEDAAVTLGVTW